MIKRLLKITAAGSIAVFAGLVTLSYVFPAPYGSSGNPGYIAVQIPMESPPMQCYTDGFGLWFDASDKSCMGIPTRNPGQFSLINEIAAGSKK